MIETGFMQSVISEESDRQISIAAKCLFFSYCSFLSLRTDSTEEKQFPIEFNFGYGAAKKKKGKRATRKQTKDDSLLRRRPYHSSFLEVS